MGRRKKLRDCTEGRFNRTGKKTKILWIGVGRTGRYKWTFSDMFQQQKYQEMLMDYK